MADFLSSRRLLVILALSNFILICGFIVFDLNESSLKQQLSYLTSKHHMLQQEIKIWEKFEPQLKSAKQKSSIPLSTEIALIIKSYNLNSARFIETKEGFSLKIGAKTDWDIYLVTHALQKHLQGRYILSHLVVMKARDPEGMTAQFQWIK